MASNTRTLADQDGDYSDWIELHNPGAVAVNLGGWYLTDSEGAPTKWRFPAVTLPANGYLVVFASGKDRAVAGAQLHANFNLSAAGEYLALVQPDGRTIASAFAPTYPDQASDISYGVVNGANYYFSRPTPNAANAAGFIAFAEAPRFSQDRGFYTAPFILNLTSDTPGASIRYTTDGTPPSETAGTLFNGPITIDRTTVLRAVAYKTGYRASKVDAQTYLFLDDVIRQSPDGKAPPGWPTSWGGNVVDYGMDPEIVTNALYSATIKDDLKTIPSFSVVMNLQDMFNSSTGIYANPGQDGRAWERPCSLELIYPDGRKGFQINAGIRIRGGFSRSTSNPKHALRFFFRDEYGEPKLRYPLFGKKGADTFDAIDLRTFQNYSWSFQGDAQGVFMRDQFSRDTQLAMGQQGERGDYYHLYINGVYWGLYNTCERPEASYGETYFGGNKDDYDVIKVEAGAYSLNATDGNMTAWTQLYNLSKAGLTNNEAYFRILGKNPDGTENPDYPNLVDAVNLTDYMLVIVYGGNLDAPISNFLGNNSPNNWYGMRNRSARDGFRFFSHDAEHTLLNVSQDRTGPFPAGDTSVLKSSPQWIWQRMWANAEYRMLCADRIHRHFFNAGALTPESARSRFLIRKDEIDRAVVAESARWGDAKRAAPLTRANWLSSVNTILNNYFPRRSDIVLGQLRAKGLYPSVAAPTFTQHGGNVPRGYNLGMSAPAGTIHYTVDGSDPRLIGGAVSPKARRFAGPLPINESLTLKARVLSGNVWSALNEAEFIVIQTYKELLVTEIMYNPPGRDGVDGDEFEFVELKNASSQTLDLSGVNFPDGINFTFANGTVLEPGQFAVLVSNPTAFASAYPGVRIAGTYQGHLSNSGERLTLAHATGQILQSIPFTDQAPWPEAADGPGFSLVPLNPNLNPDPARPENWRASSRMGGSPGRDDLPAVAGFALINEISTHSDPVEVDMVELFNPGPGAVDLGGWYLTDDHATPKKFRIPAGTVLPAGGYRVFSEADFNPRPGVDPSFSFSSHGEEVYLFSADASGTLTGFSDGFSFRAAENGVSFGRLTNSVGEVQFPAQIRKTPGAVNAGPRVGPVVINEIHYAPSPGEEEFIELKNISGTTVRFQDPQIATNRWRIEGVGFEFPAGFELAPGGLVVIVATDPGAFRQRYGVPGSTAILGPWPGSLQDNGESIRIVRPDAPDLEPDGTLVVPWITVDEVRYAAAAPWPATAAGAGPSLERIDPGRYGNDPASWRASFSVPSPGVDNAGNRPPRVSAGADQVVEARAFPINATLSGTASDDGQPNPPGTLSLRWSQVSGPGPAIFSDVSQLATRVALPGVGTYVLRLTADDGARQAADDLVIKVDRASTEARLVTAGSTWRYNDKGADLGTAWRARDFADGTWSSGKAQLGYGDNDEATTLSFGPDANNKYRTAYFRHAFEVADPKAVSALTVRLLRDDGAVVYLNGTEVFRSNMPEGAITFSTVASATVSGAEESTLFVDRAIDPGALVAGRNVLAVEVHQVNATSTDLSFDLELVAIVQPVNVAPTVRAGDDLVVTLPGRATLNGSATDDGLPIPPGRLSVTWSKVSGPGTVTFAETGAAATTAGFSAPGGYVLRLTATDGTLSSFDDVTVTVRGDTFESWRARHFTTAELADPAVSGEMADPDADGHNNGDEFRAGTNPRDPLSVLRVASATRTANGVRLRFPVVADRSYTVQYRDAAGAGPWLKLADFPSANASAEAEVVDGNAAAPARFYRIVTPQQP